MLTVTLLFALFLHAVGLLMIFSVKQVAEIYLNLVNAVMLHYSLLMMFQFVIYPKVSLPRLFLHYHLHQIHQHSV